jgi:hypothetical protein
MDIWGLLVSLAAGALGVIWLLVKGEQAGQDKAEQKQLKERTDAIEKAAVIRHDVSGKSDSELRERLREQSNR